MNAILETPASAAKTKAAKVAKRKILLVDDDPAIRQILLRLLEEEGYLVLTAANGLEAIELANTAQFDLVLLDLNMPVKDGWEAFEHFSANHPMLPVIVITARPNQLFPALASGVGALLEKPLDFTKLFHTIYQILQEPETMRLARSTGHSATFHHVAPVTNIPPENNHQ